MVKPSVSEILDGLLPKCKLIYEPVFQKFEEDQRFYECDFKKDLKLPEEFKHEGITLPSTRNMVDSFVDHINIANARVFVNKKGTSNISTEEAEMMRKFYLGVIYRTNVESSISPWRVGAKHFALHGLTVFKTVWDADRWPDKPVQHEGESEKDYAMRIDQWRHQTHQSVPIVIQAIHPHNVMPDPSFGGKTFVIERHERIRLDVSKRWPHWPNPKGKKIDEPVEYISYWDDTYRADFADGYPLLKVRGGVAQHKYGFIPYVFIDSGLGNVSYDNKPEMRYVGLLRYMLDLIISESRSYSMWDIIMGKTAWAGGFLEGENASQVTEIKQTFGTWTSLPSGVKAVPNTPLNTPLDALSMHEARTSDRIAAHAAPRSVQGLSEQGVRSGADRRTIIAEASTRYQYATEAFKNGAAKVLINCALLQKNVLPDNMRVWARTPNDEFDVVIDKDKMHEPFTCYPEFAPIAEEDEYRRHDDLERLVSSGVVTKKWARTQMSNVDALAMEAEEEKQRLMDSPLVNQLVQQFVAGKLVAAISKREGAEMVAGGMPTPTPEVPEAGRRMAPPIREVAPPGSAQEIQNQLRQLRSQTSISPTQGQGGGGFRP